MYHKGKKVKILLFLSFLSVIASTLIVSRNIMAAASTSPVISVSPEAISDLEPGKTFAINITASKVTDWGGGLWGYQFIISYDTNILTATSFESFEPFTMALPSEINDTVGYVSVAYSMSWGTTDGMTGVFPLTRLNFTVDALGASVLDLHGTVLTAPKGEVVGGQLRTNIEHTVVGGFFSNVDFEIAVSPSLTTALVNETFYIEITLAETATEIWSYNFNLTYDTEVLTAANATSLDPFSTELFSEINNTSGYVVMNYNISGGQGFSAAKEPKSIVRIEFSVDGVGRSALELADAETRDSLGNLVPHRIAHGSFSNFHDIAVTDFSSSPLQLLVGGIVTTNVTVENQGDFSETFNVTLQYADIIIETRISISLDPGASETLTFTWDTAGAPAGVYSLKTTAVLTIDAEPFDNISSAVNIVLGESQMMGVTLLYGLAIGTGAVVGISAAIFRRKNKGGVRVTS